MGSRLVPSYGNGTFAEDLFAGPYDFELFDPGFAYSRWGSIDLAPNGTVIHGDLDGVAVVSGLLRFFDTATGTYELTLSLADGEFIVVDGVASLYDGLLGGLYYDDFTVAGRFTMWPLA